MTRPHLLHGTIPRSTSLFHPRPLPLVPRAVPLAPLSKTSASLGIDALEPIRGYIGTA